VSALGPIEHKHINHLQGGPATTSEILKIESFNVIARRKALHRAWRDNFVPLVASIFVEFPDVHGFGNEDLVVMQCENHTELEELVKYLLSRGLNMTRDGAFEDFAIVHGTHGIPMPCAWLEYQRDGGAATVRLKPERDFLDFDWSDSVYEGPGWIAVRRLHWSPHRPRARCASWTRLHNAGSLVRLIAWRFSHDRTDRRNSKGKTTSTEYAPPTIASSTRFETSN